MAEDGECAESTGCLVHVLRPGDRNAKCTMTLIRGIEDHPSQQKSHPTILVDCGDPWDTDFLTEAFATLECPLDSVDYVVCSHGHGDHVANMNLFKKAIHIVGYDVFTQGGFQFHDFRGGDPYKISQVVEVIATPGHTNQDVSVIIKRGRLSDATVDRISNNQRGNNSSCEATGILSTKRWFVVAVVGDLFECELDLRYPELWQSSSDDVVMQLSYRKDILQLADLIIPGHGDAFLVLPEHRLPPEGCDLSKPADDTVSSAADNL